MNFRPLDERNCCTRKSLSANTWLRMSSWSSTFQPIFSAPSSIACTSDFEMMSLDFRFSEPEYWESMAPRTSSQGGSSWSSVASVAETRDDDIKSRKTTNQAAHRDESRSMAEFKYPVR